MNQSPSLIHSTAISNIVRQLPNEKHKLMVAAFSTKISAMPKQTALTYIVASLSTIFTICGQKVQGDVLAIYADELYNRLLEKYPHITTEELKVALRNGAFEEYGEYFGLNVKSFMHFIKCYLFSEDRKAAFAEYEKQKAKLLVAISPTPEENEKNTAAYINDLFDRFKSDDLEFELIPPFVYDFLLRNHLINESLPIAKATELLRLQHQSETYYAKRHISKLFNISRETALHITAKQAAVWELFVESAKNGLTKIIIT